MCDLAMLIRADSVALRVEGGRLGVVAGIVDASIADAEQRVEDLLAGGWSGASASAFRSAFERWKSAATAGATELHRLVDAIQETAVDVREVEDSHVELIRNLEAGLSSLPPSKGSSPRAIPGLEQLMSGK